MLNNLGVLIVTKDRALQYESCVNSLLTNGCKEIKDYHFFTLVKISSIENHNRYNQVYNEHYLIDGKIENNFQTDLINTLIDMSHFYEHVLLLTDDTLVYRPIIDLAPIIFPLSNSNVFCISLRLGENTTVQDIDNPHIPLGVPPNEHRVENDMYIWNWQKQLLSQNTGYPISMDGHIYRTKEILELTKSIQFNNLREWEGRLIDKVIGNPKIPPLMSCSKLSHCVNIPLNMVQPPGFKTIGPYGKTAEQLDKLFDDGYRVDLEETFKDIEIIGSHQYVDLRFRKNVI